MSDLMLRPEHSFLENKEYLNELITTITEFKIDGDLANEVLRADYYVNNLLKSDCNSEFKSELEQISVLFHGVLDNAYKDSLIKEVSPVFDKNLDYFENKDYIDSLIKMAENNELTFDRKHDVRSAYLYLDEVSKDFNENSELYKIIITKRDFLTKTFHKLDKEELKSSFFTGEIRHRDVIKSYLVSDWFLLLVFIIICCLLYAFGFLDGLIDFLMGVLV